MGLYPGGCFNALEGFSDCLDSGGWMRSYFHVWLRSQMLVIKTLKSKKKTVRIVLKTTPK